MAYVTHQPPAELQKAAHVKSLDQYRSMYERSVKDPEVSHQTASQDGHTAFGLPACIVCSHAFKPQNSTFWAPYEWSPYSFKAHCCHLLPHLRRVSGATLPPSSTGTSAGRASF